MKKIAWLLLCCCLVCLLVGSCTKKEDTEEAVTQQEDTDVAVTKTEDAEEVATTKPVSQDALIGKWEIIKWAADNVDQIEMWRIGSLTVEFRADGSVETQLVYSNGDERSSGGKWTRRGDKLEIHISGGGETEGDEPFERTREFTVDELTGAALSVRGEIGPAEKPIVLTYKARRLPGSPE